MQSLEGDAERLLPVERISLCSPAGRVWLEKNLGMRRLRGVLDDRR